MKKPPAADKSQGSGSKGTSSERVNDKRSSAQRKRPVKSGIQPGAAAGEKTVRQPGKPQTRRLSGKKITKPGTAGDKTKLPPEKRSRDKLQMRRPKRSDINDTAAVSGEAEKIFEKPAKKHEKKLRPLAPPKEPLSPRKRRLRMILLAIIAVVLLLSVGTILSLTVFFKIEEMDVEGKTRYPAEDIIAAANINIGDNLLLCHTSPGEEKVVNSFPYIEEAHISKRFPNRITISVKEAKPASIIESKGSYIVLSLSGKILEIDKEKKYDVPAVLGAKLKDAKEGGRIEYEDPNLEKFLNKIISGLKENGFTNIKTIDMSDTSHVTLITNKGFRIIIGSVENTDYKLRTASGIIKDNNFEGKTGTLDVSLASPDGGKSYLKMINAESSVAQESSRKEESSSSAEPESGTGEETSDSGENDNGENDYTGDDGENEYTGDDGDNDYTGDDGDNDYTGDGDDDNTGDDGGEEDYTGGNDDLTDDDTGEAWEEVTGGGGDEW